MSVRGAVAFLQEKHKYSCPAEWMLDSIARI